MNLYLCSLFVAASALLQADCSLPGPNPGTGSAAEPCRLLTTGDLEHAIGRAVTETLGPDSNFRMEILDFPRNALPDGEIRFSFRSAAPAASDGVSVLHGTIDGRDGRFIPVWARIRLLIRRNATVAVHDIEARAPLRDGMIEKREVWVPYPETRPAESELELANLGGAQMKHAVRAGQPVYASFVDLPLDIRRGQTVDLHVRSGAAHLRLQATAMQNARRGELVQLRLTDREPQLSAIATGPGSAELQARAFPMEPR